MKAVLILALLVVALCVVEGRPRGRRPRPRQTVDRPRPPLRRGARLGEDSPPDQMDRSDRTDRTGRPVPPTGLTFLAKRIAKKVAKKLVMKACTTASDCRPRQCCVRRVLVAEDSTVTFGKKGRCAALAQITNKSKFTMSVLKVQADADPISTLVGGATGPPAKDLLFICPAQSLEDSDARRRRAKKAKKVKTVNAEALLQDLLAPDVAIGSKLPRATQEPSTSDSIATMP